MLDNFASEVMLKITRAHDKRRVTERNKHQKTNNDGHRRRVGAHDIKKTEQWIGLF